ncbi:PREDICTED: uncharacterized protein LOC104835879 [Haliaeetus leucocephalus]|uniref:uncharacterized protein LOC104835879 n=1 Tax=Haliaeetus leucocephalus TaxID=52644 RepID=UPI00053CB375|nr:PREDICTED: uncharacterized protein LOC104835879 [Haliaeetus leucocephalus]
MSPLTPGTRMGKKHWFQPQSVVERIRILQKEGNVRRGKGKAIICAVLGASLAAAVEERKQKFCQADSETDSLQMVIQTLQEQLKESKQLLEEERNQNEILKKKWRNQLLREVEVEVKHSEKGIWQNYPQGDLQKAEETVESLPPKYPLIKTEYVYKDNSDDRPQVITGVPFTASEFAKLRKDFAWTAKESETEYVWRVSLSGGDGILLSEKEAEGYWGPGVFLTTGDHRAPWSLTQRAAYWAGGLNPLERGDPLAITGTVDQLVESVQKAACLQMMYDWELKPNLDSVMMMPVDPERMNPLIWGLPDFLKPIGIQLKGKIYNTPSRERITAALEGIVTPDHQWSGRKVWTWGEVAQELINFGRKYGPVGELSQRTKTRVVQAAEQASGQQSSVRKGQGLQSLRCQNFGRKRPLTRQGPWQLGLQKGIPRDLMDGLPTKTLEQLVREWSGQRTTSRPAPNAAPLLDLEEELTGEQKVVGN